MKKKITSYFKTLLDKKMQILYEPPSDLLYIFKGCIMDIKTEKKRNQTLTRKETIKEFQNLENNKNKLSLTSDHKSHLDETHLLLRGSVLRNTEFIFGMVVYSGHDTKIMMNSVRAKPKRSKLEQQLNK